MSVVHTHIRRYTFLSRPRGHRHTDRVRHRAAPGAYKPHLAPRVSQLSFSSFPFTSCASSRLSVSRCLYPAACIQRRHLVAAPLCVPPLSCLVPPSSLPTPSSGPAPQLAEPCSSSGVQKWVHMIHWVGQSKPERYCTRISSVLGRDSQICSAMS